MVAIELGISLWSSMFDSINRKYRTIDTFFSFFLHNFRRLQIFFFKFNFFRKLVWIQISLKMSLGLIPVQTVCKVINSGDYQMKAQ